MFRTQLSLKKREKETLLNALHLQDVVPKTEKIQKNFESK